MILLKDDLFNKVQASQFLFSYDYVIGFPEITNKKDTSNISRKKNQSINYFYPMSNQLFPPDQFIDFHTHRARQKAHPNFCEILSSPNAMDCLFTLERHPWTTTSMMSKPEENTFRLLLNDPNCLGMGEIGLDKLNGSPLSEQLTILRQLLKIASDEKKSVVLHCVKAFDQLIALKKEFLGSSNWAIHGFNKHPKLAKQLIADGFYLSINPAQLNTCAALLDVIPLNKLFLETDDSEDLIEENYLCVAEALSMNVDALKSQIATNANVFFKHG